MYGISEAYRTELQLCCSHVPSEFICLTVNVSQRRTYNIFLVLWNSEQGRSSSMRQWDGPLLGEFDILRLPLTERMPLVTASTLRFDCCLTAAPSVNTESMVSWAQGSDFIVAVFCSSPICDCCARLVMVSKGPAAAPVAWSKSRNDSLSPALFKREAQ